MNLDSLYRRNIFILYIYSALKGLEFYIPIYALYLEQELFTIFNVTLVLSIQAISIILFEVPTGVLADLIGRKKTLLCSGFISLLSLTLLVIGGSFIIISLSVIFGALSYSLASGTVSAIAFESVEKIKDQKPSFKRVSAIIHSLWPIGASLSSFLGGIMALVSLKMPILMTIIPFFLAFISLIFIHDEIERRETRVVLKNTFNSFSLISTNKQLFLLLMVGFLSYAFSEVAHVLKPVYFEFKGIPLEFFGFLYTVTFGLSFIGSILSERISEIFGNKKTLIFATFISLMFVISSVVTDGLVSGILLAIASFSWGIRWPIVSYLMNLELPDDYRATVLSIATLTNHLGFAIFSPILGYLVESFDIIIVYLVQIFSSLFLITTYFLLEDKE
ncbi:MAG: MFS transporter [Candidatus Hodarchaeales archaeon]|jgi:MFS family permease